MTIILTYLDSGVLIAAARGTDINICLVLLSCIQDYLWACI
ncbi:hypothetical protein PCC7805_01152 [Planktothrix agardhii]|jgi:hypothetical protein|nr:hypothetical protein [Planktothrix agardhii]BBD55038.1 hypothetical protein NIES204_23380 [Planktothrix agardhii NIES-204]CAD5928703.1 hypothetical protein PCC7805_01152 [Planktothrix agardhii]CAD5934889.1 hypothetical protein NO365_01535 [Planktothrix agardhii]